MIHRTFVDTNVLVYLFDADSPAKQARAREILEDAPELAAVSSIVAFLDGDYRDAVRLDLSEYDVREIAAKLLRLASRVSSDDPAP